MEAKHFLKTVILIKFACLICACFISCTNKNKINFKDYPADYKIAYFENFEVKNIPSVNNLFGKHASYADEFMGTPTYVIIDSYNCTSSDFSVVIIIRVKETNYDIARITLNFEADNITNKNYIRYAKVESLLSDKFLESKSDGTEEQDMQTLLFLVGYMNMIWK